MIKRPLLLIGFALLLALFYPAGPGLSQPARPEAAQIRDFLEAHPRITGSGAEVLDVLTMRGALVIDLSPAVLPDGVYDEALFNQLQTDLDQALHINQFYMTTFKVAGQPLEYWGQPTPDTSQMPEWAEPRELPGAGPLAGVRIALSPGHGRYWNETHSAWFWQRALFWGIREDTLNAEILRYVQAALMNQGATVIQLRELDFSARIGVSGFPAWHEAARQYAIYQGLPEWVYNSGTGGLNYNSDIRARPYMANYYGADLLISLHNNGWNGTLSGTETYWDLHNHPGSHALARAVHDSIINTIHTEKDPAWIDRGVKGSNRNYGEISYAHMPAILIELAFMDRQFPDNAYLQTESFKLLAARAITRGICDYWGVTCESAPIILPGTLESPVLTPAYTDGTCDSGWQRFPNQRAQYAYLALNSAEATHQAEWGPALPMRGEYRLEAFIPAHNPFGWECPQTPISDRTVQAVYQVEHANGTTSLTVNQAGFNNAWVDLGIFHFDNETQPRVTLTNTTQEPPKSTAVVASALRITLVGNAGTPFYNTAWVNGSWLREGVDTSEEHIRHFLAYHNTCLDAPITDSDGQQVDLPALIHQAAIENQINPIFLLAIIEAEGGALSQCPDADALSNLAGLEGPDTARGQITAAAAQIGKALDALETTQITPRGWATGAPKETLDGVRVTPANDTITVLFDFSQNAGAMWGGISPGNNGMQGFYTAWRDFNLHRPLFWGMQPVFLPMVYR